MRRFKVLGPPGTGKTRFLEQKAVTGMRRGLEPGNLLACSFTRSAADVLRSRLALACNVDPDALTWVRTIHSAAHRLLNAKSENKLGSKTLAGLFGSLHVRYHPKPRKGSEDLFDEPVPTRGVEDDDEGEWFLGYWDWFRACCHEKTTETVERMAARFPGTHIRGDTNVSRMIARRCWQPYEALLHSDGYWDFASLLEDVLVRHLRPSCAVVMLDEAQDMSPLQWQVGRFWIDGAECSWVAGDPNQAIYTFAGADPRLFYEYDAEPIYLERSYRFGQEHVDYCKQILRLGPDNVIPAWYGDPIPGRDEDGSEFWLGRTRALVNEQAGAWMASGTPFRNWRGRDPLNPRGKVSGVHAALIMAENGQCTAIELERLVSCIPGTSEWLERGAKKEISTAVARYGSFSRITFDDLPRLKVREKLIAALRAGDPWAAFTKLDQDDQDYYLRVARQHGTGALIEPPPRIAATIHAAKGHEADHVTLCTSWAKRPYQAYVQEDRSGEARVAYTGASRPRVTLRLDRSHAGNQFPI